MIRADISIDIEEIFSRGGSLSGSFADYEQRPEQIAMAHVRQQHIRDRVVNPEPILQLRRALERAGIGEVAIAAPPQRRRH